MHCSPHSYMCGCMRNVTRCTPLCFPQDIEPSCPEACCARTRVSPSALTLCAPITHTHTHLAAMMQGTTLGTPARMPQAHKHPAPRHHALQPSLMCGCMRNVTRCTPPCFLQDIEPSCFKSLLRTHTCESMRTHAMRAHHTPTSRQ